MEPLDASTAMDDASAGAEALARANMLRDFTITAMGNQEAQQHRDTERYATVRTGQYVRRSTMFAPGQLVYLTRKQLHSTDTQVRDIILRVAHVDGNVVTLQGRCGSTIRDNIINIRRCHLPNINVGIDPSLRQTTVLQPCERCLEYNSPPDNRMLVCDGCSTCWHCGCCTPPLQRPPSGNWFCAYCCAAGRDRQRPPSNRQPLSPHTVVPV
jgi:hypothetical protein